MDSPDLENAHLFGFWCSNPHAKNVQANGRFCLLAKGSKFSKGALRAVGAIAFVAAGGGTFHRAPAAVHVKAVADSALRCTGFSLLRVRQQCC